MAKKTKSTAGKTQPSPPKTNSSLERLGVLVGEWNVEISSMSFDPDPSAIVRGRSSFEWLEGGAFLIERSEPNASDFPSGTMIIGPDDTAGTYCMLYFDSRGVSRIYQMSLRDGT
ncbi:MAG TPA: hypothetical protein VLE49_08150, partial [Anaerolineales bacterium]|nr:hypothetical protein [Anaerolineales bacterium]